MKLINLAILTLSLLILSNAQSTEENPPSEDSSSRSDDTPSEDQTEESTENPESSSSSDDDQDGAHQSGEPAEGSESTPQSGDGDQNHQEGGQDKDSKQNGNPEQQPADAATAGAAKGSYLETYNEIGKILDAVDFKSIEDLHLQRMLENNFQGRLRNPIRSQTGQIADFSAIQSCFGSLGGDVQKLIDDAKKEFETCKAGDGADSAVCTDQQENKFADGVIAVATTLQGCIASQRKD